ncbi:MAG: MFS transporter [Gemmataceae bacterium]
MIHEAAPPTRLHWSLNARLSAMMFLQFAVWGAWTPVLGGLYLNQPQGMGFSGTQTAQVYATWAAATIIAPLIAGQLVDRWFATQRFLAVVNLLGAGLMFLMAHVAPGHFWEFFGWMALYQLLCAPTMSLTVSLAFHHLPDGQRQFGVIRLWGTVGFIVVSLVFGEWLKDWATLRQLLGQSVDMSALMTNPMKVGQCLNWAGVLSLVFGMYCLTLPHTPPATAAKNPYAFLAALELLREKSFAVLLIVSVIVATELQFYFIFASKFFASLGFAEGTAAQLMTIGQIVEVFTLLALPWFVARYGIKTTIAVGILAWTIRYGIFAWGEPRWLVVASQGLHGLAYGFFMVGGMMYTDRVASKDIRASAQGLLLLATLGVGKLISSQIAGPVKDYFTIETSTTAVTNWHMVFLVPVMVTLVGAVGFLLFFHEKKEIKELDAAVGPPRA